MRVKEMLGAIQQKRKGAASMTAVRPLRETNRGQAAAPQVLLQAHCQRCLMISQSSFLSVQSMHLSQSMFERTDAHRPHAVHGSMLWEHPLALDWLQQPLLSQHMGKLKHATGADKLPGTCMCEAEHAPRAHEVQRHASST